MSHRVTPRATPTNGGGKAPAKHPWEGNPGWFMEPVRAWKSMRFESQLCGTPTRYQNTSFAAMLTRQRRLDAGSEEAKGYICMPNSVDLPLPGWMGPRPVKVAK